MGPPVHTPLAGCGKTWVNETEAPHIRSPKRSLLIRAERTVHPKARCGPRGRWRHRVGSCRGLHERPHPHQVVDGCREGEQPADSRHAPEFDLAQQSHRLQPAEDFFHPFALLLMHSIAGVPRGPAINRTGTVCRMLGHMGHDLHRLQILDELMGVIVLIALQRVSRPKLVVHKTPI
jgi:hypothetical protein